MLTQLRAEGHSATTAIEHASSALTESVTADKEARATVKRVVELARVARKEAQASVKKSIKDKKEAENAKNEAIEMSKKLRDPRHPL